MHFMKEKVFFIWVILYMCLLTTINYCIISYSPVIGIVSISCYITQFWRRLCMVYVPLLTVKFDLKTF